MDILLYYFPGLTPAQREQFAALESLYREWNERINVISRKDIDHLYVRHVLHSLSIAKVCTMYPGARILDVGCGGGFPGIPLAIFFPGSHFTLVDSIGKKIHVVEEVSRTIGLRNVTPLQVRAEELNASYDFVVSRAVTRMDRFIGWVWNRLLPGNTSGSLANGILYLKGGDLTDELNSARKHYENFSISDFFPDPFFETKQVIYCPR